MVENRIVDHKTTVLLHLNRDVTIRPSPSHAKAYKLYRLTHHAHTQAHTHAHLPPNNIKETVGMRTHLMITLKGTQFSLTQIRSKKGSLILDKEIAVM